MLNRKMLLAPFLAVALVLSLSVAVSVLPASPQNKPSNPTPSVNFNAFPPAPSSSAGSYGMAAPAPTALPSTAPTAIPESLKSSVDLIPIISVAAAIVVGVVSALLFFSERSLKKELGDSESQSKI
ncbi:MAG: hypothetical protein ACLQO7_05810 [Candidatus Bathyarchaeia archaeon]